MKRFPFSFARAAEQQRLLERQIGQTKKSYLWWFDAPTEWDRPRGTLYLWGWCIGRDGNQVRGVRARIGRRKFLGNYGIDRRDVAAAHRKSSVTDYCGFAVAVRLPAGSSQVITEIQTSDGEWRPISVRTVQGAPNDDSPAPCDPKYFIPNRRPNSRIQFWFDRPSVWTKKIRYLRVTGWCFAVSGDPIHEIRARVRGKIFRAHFGTVRPDIGVIFNNRVGALRSGFSLDATIPPGRSDLVFEARSAGGPWEIFCVYSVRGPFLHEELDEGREAVGDYAFWIRRYDTLRRADLRAIRKHIAELQYQPLISVLLPVYNSNPKWLRRAILSVQQQLYPHYELCAVDDASTAKGIWSLLQKVAARDQRIKIMRRAENGHISIASNDALALATGEFIALLDHDDELAPTALYHAVVALNENPRLQLLYSDEDKLDRQGRRCDPYFKSDWNPDLFLAQNFISHLGIYRAELVRRAGGFRTGFEGSQDYDLTLRCIEQIEPNQIRHLPVILYHWRTTEESTASFATVKPYAQEAARRAVQEHLDRVGNAATVDPHYGSYLRVTYALPAERPLVSIVIPTRDRASLLQKCLESIFAKTDYQNFEVIVIDNQSSDAEALQYLEDLKKHEAIRVERITGPFNYSLLNNRGIDLARGTVIALLNNDVEVINASWLSEMVGHALRPEVGMVGARLWYHDGTMQHGGVILGAGGIAGHAHTGIRYEHGYFARAHLTQNFSSVTAACAVMRRELYQQVGGLDQVHLAVAFNDVDLCLRLRAAGYWIVWTPHAELYHEESASRGFEDSTPKQVRFLAEIDYMNGKWGEVLKRDPFYNPNLSLDGERLFTLAFPPRISFPWRRS